MEIKKVKIDSIKVSDNNPRVIRDAKFLKLIESIKNFPKMLEIRPIVINAKSEVIGGNMRLKACKEIGLKEVFVIDASTLSEDEQRQFMIKDNVSFGEWNWDTLANQWDNTQLNDWGMDVWDQKDGEYFDVEEAEEVEKKPRATDDDYSVFELVMLHENKLIFLQLLNEIKAEKKIDKQEDALMELILNYKNK